MYNVIKLCLTMNHCDLQLLTSSCMSLPSTISLPSDFFGSRSGNSNLTFFCVLVLTGSEWSLAFVITSKKKEKYVNI